MFFFIRDKIPHMQLRLKLYFAFVKLIEPCFCWDQVCEYFDLFFRVPLLYVKFFPSGTI